MSYTTIYKVPEKGSIEVTGEVHNAFRGAMNIWIEMYKKYLYNPFSMVDSVAYEVMLKPEQVWELFDKEDIDLRNRIVLDTTFDYVMVRRENLPKVITAFKTWDMEKGTLLEQAEILEKLKDDPTCYAVCWCQTSVVGDMWWIDEGEDGRMYDISKDTKHWFLFKNLP